MTVFNTNALFLGGRQKKIEKKKQTLSTVLHMQVTAVEYYSLRPIIFL